MSSAEQYPVVSLRPKSGPAPVASIAPIEAPAWLTEKGATAWERLARINTLTPGDVDEFAAYCEAVAEYEETTELLAELGLMILDPATGAPVPNPITLVRDKADRKIAFWANRFRG